MFALTVFDKCLFQHVEQFRLNAVGYLVVMRRRGRNKTCFAWTWSFLLLLVVFKRRHVHAYRMQLLRRRGPRQTTASNGGHVSSECKD